MDMPPGEEPAPGSACDAPAVYEKARRQSCDGVDAREICAEEAALHGEFTAQEALDRIGFGRWHVYLLLYCGLVWASDATEIMLLSYLGPAVACEWNVSASGEAWLTSTVFMGMLLGAWFWGAVADALGRRPAFLVAACLTAAFGLTSAAAPSYAVLLVARAGVGFGLAGSITAYTLFMEWLPACNRGRWLVVFQLWWTFGTLAEVALAASLLNGVGWRALAAASAAPFAVLLTLFPLLPDSPKLLMVQGEDARALALLQRAARVCGRPPLLGRLVATRAETQGARDHHPELHQHGRGGGGGGGGEGRSGSGCDHATDAGAVREEERLRLLRGVGNGAGSSAGVNSMDSADATPSPGATGSTAGSTEDRGVVSRWLGDFGGLWADVARLAQPQVAPVIVALCGIWFVASLSYYGMVLLSAELTAHQGGGPGGGPGSDPATSAALPPGTNQATAMGVQDSVAPPAPPLPPPLDGMCTGPGGRLHLPAHAFAEVAVASAAELPAMAFCLFFAGGTLATRHLPITVSYGLVAAALSLLLVAPDAAGAFLDITLFSGRFFVMAGFTLLYIFTPELLPTRVRGFALGTCNSVSRLGGLVAPFVSVALVEQGRVRAAAGALSGACVGAALLTMWVGVASRGAELQIF